MEEIFNRVRTIFEQRYGAELKIDQELTATHKKQQTHRHWKSPFVYSRTLRQVSFPILNAKEELNAVVTAHPVDNKDAVVFAEMAEFLNLTISEFLDLQEKLSDQERTMEVVERSHTSGNKVVELRTKKTSNQPQVQYKDRKLKRPADLRPIWISGDNDVFNSNIAFSVHDWVGNWAFINAKETPDLIWEDTQQWQNFPQVTIFIPSIDQLSSVQIETLKENLQAVQKLDGEKPLVVVTAPNEISPELEKLKTLFKNYKANDKVAARVQAHFLVYHHKEASPFTHECEQTKGLYFLPFSRGSDLLH